MIELKGITKADLGAAGGNPGQGDCPIFFPKGELCGEMLIFLVEILNGLLVYMNTVFVDSKFWLFRLPQRIGQKADTKEDSNDRKYDTSSQPNFDEIQIGGQEISTE